MKVTKIIREANKPLFSYEIMPPLRGGSAGKIFRLVEDLMPYNPPFIDLTSRSAEIEYFDTPNGKFERHVRRKRPGTIGLSAAIKTVLTLKQFHTFFVMVLLVKRQKMH